MSQEDKEGQGSPSSPTKKNGIDDKDYDLEQSVWNLEQLKEAAAQLRLLRPRSLAWAILLNALPPPNADIMSSLRSHRNLYNDLKEKLSMDPHGVIGDDPLSQNDKSVWKQHFCDNELKALILQDVVRTFPDELFFREQDVQDLMVRVLFHWARAHAHVGYRQGMHEVLAPALAELYRDRKFSPKHVSDTLRYILSEDHLEHDSYMLFSAMMVGLERFYTTGDVVPTACGRMPHTTVIHNPNEVVRYLDKVREEYLVPLDSELAAHLNNFNISMELFGIRWLRLLFGREFPRSEIPHLWGFLFADGPTLPNLHYVIVAMLMSIRNTLLSGECGSVLATLMRASTVSVAHVVALVMHLKHPHLYPAPQTPAHNDQHLEAEEAGAGAEWCGAEVGEEAGAGAGAGGAWRGDEGPDVARSLAALAAVRARLPAAAAELARALPAAARLPPAAARALHQILQLAALVQCRNHALADVETALEAAEGDASDGLGRRRPVPVTVKRTPPETAKPANKAKEVPLKLFHQAECRAAGDLPRLDPLRLRTE